MGRLNLEPDQRAQVVRTLMDLSYDAEGNDSPRAQLVGVTLGLESLTRIGRGQPLDAAVTDRLRELLRHGLAEQPQTSTMVQIRTLAATALGNAGQINVFDIETGLRDVGEGPRRAVAAHLDRIQAGARQEFIRRALGDPSAQVRLEAVRALARGPRDALSCEWILAVVGARELLHSRLEAIDALDRPCSNVAVQTSALTDLARSLSDTDTRDWHAPAHALKALAGLAPTRAAPFLSPFAGHSNDFVRLYAVQAAGRIGTTATVLPFLDDSSANVRTAAARELFALEGRRADPLLLELLAGAEDPQLVLTLAGLLRDSPLRSEVGEAALATLERISEPRWQTLRDPRVALIDLVETMGDSGWASGVEPYLRDYDPVVAQRAAEILIGWTGQRYLAAPRGSPRIPYPTLDDLRLMETATVRLHLERGGVIDIGLRPDLAATNAFRFLSLARQGSLDGLTFHRVAPNFVVQGGSPGANEFAGHGAYTRDEVGLSVQWQGTVGLSTRGRDTGDGQLYINLIDNVRLDHDYTIFGNVTNGMAAVHGIMEGDVIERAEVHVARQLPAR
jgi:cyclophilin family peptidyl-prolyl cis-trans isomerase/HEAT repeat protein